MGRSYTIREASPKKKGLHPIWRGIGCVLLVILTVGGYLLAGYLLDLNNQNHYVRAIPQRLPSWEIVKDVIVIPGRIIVQLGFMLVLDVVVYAIMVVIYSILNPPKLGPTDAPPARRKKGRRDSELR